MPNRYKEQSTSLFPNLKLKPFSALKEKFKDGYSIRDFASDLMSGVVVGMVAIPLGMALAIASGVSPQNGLYTVVIAGSVVALLGGSRYQVSGPTAAFVVILAPIAQKFGFAGLLVAGLMSGILLVMMGVARMGRLIQFIPHPVTTGFTSGIAVVISTIQIKDFFGLKVGHLHENFLGRLSDLFAARSSWNPIEFYLGVFTLFFLIIWPKVNKKIPAPLVALSVVTIISVSLKRYFPSLEISTIFSRFNGIPQSAPHFSFPWDFPGPNGQKFILDFTMIESLVPSAFAIAMLGAIESLLSAVIADGMTQTRHDPDAELIALGTGNILCPFFGGIAATGAIARTATNIRFGAKSPISAVIHAFFTLMVILLLAPYVSYLPMAGLAALLLLVAYNMSEIKQFVHIVKIAPKGDVIVLLLCFGLTVVFDMVVGVTVGIVLAALLFMRSMAFVTQGHALMNGQEQSKLKVTFPKDVMIYEIAGPLFFGAAQNAMDAISVVNDQIQTVILNLEHVPVMDVSGLVAFESVIEKLISSDRNIILASIQPQPYGILSKEGLLKRVNHIHVCKNLTEAIQLSEKNIENVKFSSVLHPRKVDTF